MDATNISINQSSGVSINIEALQEIKKHFNVDTLVSSFLQSGVQTLCASGRAERRFQVSMLLPRLYRKELRLARAVATWCDRHNTLVNWLMAIQVIAFAFYVFMFV